MAAASMSYIERLLKAQLDQAMPKGVVDCAVAHDDWCEIYKSRACTCVPDITLTCDKQRWSVDASGNLLREQ